MDMSARSSELPPLNMPSSRRLLVSGEAGEAGEAGGALGKFLLKSSNENQMVIIPKPTKPKAAHRESSLSEFTESPIPKKSNKLTKGRTTKDGQPRMDNQGMDNSQSSGCGGPQ